MPYETLKESVSVLKPVGQVLDAQGNTWGYEHVSVIYADKGTVIDDADVSPVVQKMIDEGDAWTCSLLKKIAKPRAKKTETEEVEA
jgi:N-acetylglucosamine kinase-like BadF-type ATPase